MCDTFVALQTTTTDNSVIFGKNSDREPNEAQALEYYPAKNISENKSNQVQCTHISIPQVKETYAVLLSRPFWMWGAEMGANEKGVVIGNEAVFTKMPYSKTGVLTGMDLLRLALERSGSAEQALETIIQLLTDHGQGGICGYHDKKMVYHNSFIIADSSDAWILETAGHLWAALKVKDIHSISNGLTIGEEYDRSHPDLVDTAQSKGWLKKGNTFNFAKSYSDWFYTTFSGSRQRRDCSFTMLQGCRGDIDTRHAFRILRNHHKDPYYPDSHFFGTSVCAHAGNSLSRNFATTGSLVVHLRPNHQVSWATGTSGPCTGIFKPIWFQDRVLPDLGPTPGPTYDPDSLWWYHEQLHRSVIMDYEARIEMYQKERDLLESEFIEKVGKTGYDNCFAFTLDAFERSKTATETWIKTVQDQPVSRSRFMYNYYWKKQNRDSKIMVC